MWPISELISSENRVPDNLFTIIPPHGDPRHLTVLLPPQGAEGLVCCPQNVYPY